MCCDGTLSPSCMCYNQHPQERAPITGPAANNCPRDKCREARRAGETQLAEGRCAQGEREECHFKCFEWDDYGNCTNQKLVCDCYLRR
jgi:hypothetical protein